MKKILSIIAAFCITAASFAQSPTITVSGHVTSNTTWKNTSIYKLDGFVYVDSLVTLTIEPGTIIRGIQETKGSLIIKRGAKIMAEGTVNAPIVFTSDKPAGQRALGDWGGLILLGRAKTNQAGGKGLIEGGVEDGFYGGTDNNDNSGILKYVRVEYAGIAFAPNNEINGITFGAVGAGTTIDNVQVSFSGDDSFEWFGGNMNAKHLIAFRGLDDDFDTDNGFSGKLQFLLGHRDPKIGDQSGSNGFESDNDASGSVASPKTSAIFSNVTLIGPKNSDTTSFINANYKRGAHIRRNSSISTFNSMILGYPTGVLLDGTKTKDNAEGDTMRFSNNYIVGSTKKAFDTVSMKGATFNIANYMTAHNTNALATVAEAKLGDLSTLTSSQYLPLTGSPLLTGGTFTDSYLSDPFFTQVTHIGAFGTDDWTASWANFNPDTVDYSKVMVVTGVKTINNTVSNLSVYPNPASDLLNIDFGIINAGKYSIQLTNVLGDVVRNISESNFNTGKYNVKLNTSNIANGLYFLRITSDTASVNQKVFIQK